jgi:lipopolysaccharide/colanic/teichoic acid biosynthesis glycosyltransferase
MKRVCDVLLSLICLVACAPFMLLIAAAVLLIDGVPVLFRQVRVGRNMQPFTLIKFRTMRVVPAGGAITVGADPRITRLGRWLRSSHLDELPQLLNILSGRMSFVGPRPEIPEFIDREDPLHQEVCSVRPGLFDAATLAWSDEAKILAQANDWREYYRQTVLPDKLARSRAYLAKRSIRSDVAVTARIIAGMLGIGNSTRAAARRLPPA